MNNNQTPLYQYKYFGLIIFLLSNLLNLAIQIGFITSKWSPFFIRHLQFNYEIVEVYVLSMCILTLGFISYERLTKNNSFFVVKNNPFIDQLKLEKLVKLNSMLLLIFLIITQFNLGKSNIFYLWAGLVRGPDVEIAIHNSFPGVHGLLLLLIFTSLILWSACFIAGSKNKAWIFVMLTLSILSAISQGKVQLLFYFGVFYLCQQRSFYRLFLRSISCFLVILILFFISRLLRNQGLGFDGSIDTFLFFAVGLYLGSPFINSAYILQQHALMMNSMAEFFRHLIPIRLLGSHDWANVLPDASSPNGFIGNGLLLGGPFWLYVYCFLVGLFLNYLYTQSIHNLSMKLFYPFLITACLLSFSYDHFMNLMFFWIPMLMSFFVVKLITSKRIA